MFYVSLKTSVTAVTAIWLSVAVAADAKADAASCPSSIPFGLTTALTGNLALLGTQARNGAEFDEPHSRRQASCYPWIDDQPACVRADRGRHQIRNTVSGRRDQRKSDN